MSLTTPISKLLAENGGGNAPPGNNPGVPNPNPTAQFGQLPGGKPVAEEVHPVTNQQPHGVGQGISKPDTTPRKEFFGLKESDYKTAILVFAILLILCSSIFYTVLRPYVPSSVGSDGKVTLIGSFVAALVGTLIFVAVKKLAKF